MITLATLPQATAQQVYDQVKAHLLKQNKKATISYGVCVYRNPDELKCAAGCLIGDDEYKANMEGLTWTGLADHGIVPNEHHTLITRLQSIHDWKEPDEWAEALAQFAIREGLEP